MKKLKEQLKILVSYFGAVIEGNVELEEALPIYNKVITMIDDQTKRMEWHPPTDIPEKDGDEFYDDGFAFYSIPVLGFEKRGKFKVIRYYTWLDEKGLNTWTTCCSEAWNLSDDEILGWQYLPEIPKEMK